VQYAVVDPVQSFLLLRNIIKAAATMTEVPVIIGVGDVKNRDINDAKEPATLMLEAIGIALKDAQALHQT
jgi:hypothetical protein